MSTDAQQFLASFEALPPDVRREVAAAIQLRAIREGTEPESADRDLLRSQIQHGIDTPGVPADEAIARLRQTVAELNEGRS